MLEAKDVEIETLGPPAVDSPVKLSSVYGDGIVNFVAEDAKIRHTIELSRARPGGEEVLFEKAGPRERIYFQPQQTRAAIVTCGGLCPGLNNVIRSIFLELHYHYGLKEVLGVRYGYRGLNPEIGEPPTRLTPDFVAYIHKQGGTVLGSSRGPQDVARMVDTLQQWGVDILFCIGGDGTQRGAHAIADEAQRRGAPIAVVGVPKTIDNDIPYVWRTFGYYSAVEQAREVITCAHAEAVGAVNGISLVKLMGRDAGFIVASATVASQDVNFALVPEVPFELGGDRGLLRLLKERILARRHAVVAVAEGAGQHLIPADQAQRDASGNIRYRDVGQFLRREIIQYFEKEGIAISLKYFDPSYMIRSVAANCDDSLLCDQLARHAAHAAMAGKTDLLIGLWYNCFIHVPIQVAVAGKKQLDPEGELWRAVLANTGQPARLAGR